MARSSNPPAANLPTALTHVQPDHQAFIPTLVLIQEVYAASKQVRAQIYERSDGLYSLEFERLMPGDPEHDEPSYWSPLNRPKTIVVTVESARAIALEGLIEAAGVDR